LIIFPLLSLSKFHLSFLACQVRIR
jgi:hypothetical protein